MPHQARNDADGEATVAWWFGLLEWRAGNWEEAESVCGGIATRSEPSSDV